MLEKCERWFSTLPPAAALEKTADALGLAARAALREGGNEQAGSLMKALEILRDLRDDAWSQTRLLEKLEALIPGDTERSEEEHDGIPAVPPGGGQVRLMTLHRAKGLEAPVVFLADPFRGGEHGVEIAVDRSAEETRGYLIVCDPRTRNSRSPRVLAQPPDWETVSQKELRFDQAERLRLRYVAATRAASALIITQNENGRGSNFWSPFSSYLPPETSLEDPGEVAPSPPPPEDIEIGRDWASLEDISRRTAGAIAPTYEIWAAKEFALCGSGPGEGEARETTPPPAKNGIMPAEDVSGTEWGSVIHVLLESMGRGSASDMETLAADLLAERELDPALAQQAVFLAESAASTELWARSLRSDARLVEMPFYYCPSEGDGIHTESEGRPLLLRGAIDLAFRENGHWVLVDFKTDHAPEEELETLARRYAPQLRLYSRVFEACSGEPVSERILFFVRSGHQFSVD